MTSSDQITEEQIKNKYFATFSNKSMILEFAADGETWRSEVSRKLAIDCCLPVRPLAPATEQTSAFGLGAASSDTVCEVSGGASVNCVTNTFCPHSAGTHTECAGHVLGASEPLGSDGKPQFVSLCSSFFVEPEPFLPCLVASVKAVSFSETGDTYNNSAESTDKVISKDAIREAVSKIVQLPLGEEGAQKLEFCTAVLIRCQELGDGDRKQFTGTNPPYFTIDAAKFLVDLGLRHLLVNLPSVDRESSGETVPVHHIILQTKNDSINGEFKSTITELVSVPPNVTDGRHVLSLNISPIDLDAAPSRPLLWKCDRT